MKFLLIIFAASLASSTCALAQSILVSPIQVLRNAKKDKEVLNLIKTKDARFVFSQEQEGRYTIVKSKTSEMWLSNYSKSVEVYSYKVNMSVAGVKREMKKFGASFGSGNSAYIGNGIGNSTCYSIDLKPDGANKTKIEYSYECD